MTGPTSPVQPADLSRPPAPARPADALAREAAEALYAREGVASTLGIALLEVREGFARLSMPVGPAMLNGHRTAHGGMIFTLADTAFAYACNSRNLATVAAQASIIFLSPAREGEVLGAEAVERAACGRSGAFWVDVRTADGRPVASFQGLARTVGGPVISPEEHDIG